MRYSDDAAKWVLGQVKSVTCVAPAECTPSGSPNGIVMSQTDYDATTALPVKTYAYGVLQQSMTYNTDGTLATVKDGNNNTTTYSNWKRGIPQLIQFPATPDESSGSSQSAVVDDNGWITSVTDQTGATTSYTYDPVGRLASIAYPGNDTNAWNGVALSFVPVSTAEYGLPAGHWRSSRYQGYKHTNVYYDAMWRPVLEETFDYNDIANTRSQVIKRYDDQGRLAFQSYPVRSVTSYTDDINGVFTEYDALDRVTSVNQDSELGLLTTLTEYLPGFKIRVTDPRMKSTTTSFMAFDQPTYDLPVSITGPLGQITDISRDVFGKPKSIRRHNAANTESITRSYVYGTDQRLCKMIEPENSATVTHYDAAGNVDWTAAGLNLPDPTLCNNGTLSYDSGRRVDRTYDQRNRLKTLSFPDGNSSQQWTYWPDSLPKQITTQTIPPGTTTVKTTVNTYNYNKRRLLTDERSVLQDNFNYLLTYGYNANGDLDAQSYPDNLIVNYDVNALGQPTRVRSQDGNYATGVRYHPNGAIQQFTYGNGIVHTMSQNPRQLPQRTTDAGILNFGITYDKNANTTVIYDDQQGANFYRAMTYDDLNRLTDAGSPAFEGNQHHVYTYDTLDNLKTSVNGTARNYYYNYESGTNRLLSITNGQGGAAIQGFGFDPQGNLANKNGIAFKFDYGNRLREAGAANTSFLERYRYDGQGRRVFQNRLIGPTGTVGVVYSQYANSGQLLFQQDTAKSKNTDYIYLGGSLLANRDQPFGQPAVITYQHTDPLGTPVAITNGAGALVARTAYEPYGKTYGSVAKDGPGYTGHVLDTSTGLNYMQQRYYDPAIGRFLSVDPVTADASKGTNFNRYWYANNNPYRFTDPDGRTCQSADGQYSCIVDSYNNWRGKEIPRSEMTKGQLKRVAGFEKSYTSAVNKIMANPQKSVTISMPGKAGGVGRQATTTAGEVGKALIGRNIVANNPKASGGMATGGNTTFVGPMGLSGEGSLTGVTVNDADAMRQVEIIHEGMHGDGTKVSMVLRGDLDQSSWNAAHQTPFNQASIELLDPQP